VPLIYHVISSPLVEAYPANRGVSTRSLAGWRFVLLQCPRQETVSNRSIPFLFLLSRLVVFCGRCPLFLLSRVRRSFCFSFYRDVSFSRSALLLSPSNFCRFTPRLCPLFRCGMVVLLLLDAILDSNRGASPIAVAPFPAAMSPVLPQSPLFSWNL